MTSLADIEKSLADILASGFKGSKDGTLTKEQVTDSLNNYLTEISKVGNIGVFNVSGWQVLDWQVPARGNKSIRAYYIGIANSSQRFKVRHRFSSRRKARMYAKRNYEGTLVSDLCIRPVQPVEFITIDLVVNKTDSVK